MTPQILLTHLLILAAAIRFVRPKQVDYSVILFLILALLLWDLAFDDTDFTACFLQSECSSIFIFIF